MDGATDPTNSLRFRSHRYLITQSKQEVIMRLVGKLNISIKPYDIQKTTSLTRWRDKLLIMVVQTFQSETSFISVNNIYGIKQPLKDGPENILLNLCTDQLSAQIQVTWILVRCVIQRSPQMSAWTSPCDQSLEQIPRTSPIVSSNLFLQNIVSHEFKLVPHFFLNLLNMKG